MSYEIHSPAKRANVSTYGGVVLAFDSKGIARVDSLTPALSKWLSAAGYEVRDLDNPSGEPTQFDPSDYRVEEVTKYLADADATERARVLDLERAGKNRASIIGESEAS